MTGPTSKPVTPVNQVTRNDDNPNDSPNLQDQILDHVSSLKALIKQHNEISRALIEPIRLSFGEEDGNDKGKGADKGEKMHGRRPSEAIQGVPKVTVHPANHRVLIPQAPYAYKFKDLRWLHSPGRSCISLRGSCQPRRMAEASVDVPEVMQISAFMSNSKCPKLSRRFSDQVPKTVTKMMKRVDDFSKSEEVYKTTELPRGEIPNKGQRTSYYENRPPRAAYRGGQYRTDNYNNFNNRRDHYQPYVPPRANNRRQRGNARGRQQGNNNGKGKVINMIWAQGDNRKRKSRTGEEEDWMNSPTTFPSTELVGFSREQLIPIVKVELEVAFGSEGLCRRTMMKFTVPSDITGVPKRIIKHTININMYVPPVAQKQRVLGTEESRAEMKEVEEWIKAGIVRPVWYPTWISNPVLVKKVDNIWRMCIDFKNVNSSCPKDYYPLLKIDLKLNRLWDFASSVSWMHTNVLQRFLTLINKPAKKKLGHIRMQPSDITGVPKRIIKHTININMYVPSVAQKRRVLGTEESRAEMKEVEEWIKADIDAVSEVLLGERKRKQIPIFHVSQTLYEAERKYGPLEKLALRLLHLSRRLRCRSPNSTKDEGACIEGKGRLEASSLSIKWEVHEGACEMHSEPRSVVAKIMRQGYYWPTMHQDAREIEKCDSCQIHALIPRLLKTLMTSIMSLWPFYQWGIDILGPLQEGLDKLKYIITMLETSNGETPSSLTYGSEAVIPTEIGMPSFWTIQFNEARIEEEMRLSLALIQERRETAAIREAKYKKKVEQYYNKMVRPVFFRVEDFVYQTNEASMTMLETSNGETPSSLTYGSEAVIPTEIGMPSFWTIQFNEARIEEEMRLSLALIQERRETAAIREAKYKKKVEQYYNKMVRPVFFRVEDFVYQTNEASMVENQGKLGPN
nr:hypothetical protein [Tanacetum cinerariifolium]